MEKKNFKILGIQQIAIGGLTHAKNLTLWKDLFGLEKAGVFKSETENVDEVILKLGDGKYSIEVDIMKPLDPEKKPQVHIPPLNHIGLWVDHLENAVDFLSKHGVRFAPGGIRKGASGYNVIFIHPKGNEEFPLGGEGVLIELVQAPDEMIDKK
ncbi:MAG: VOC family protein [Spirochaetia bacterium]|nr:VOC family protein [Spirochaetia bacterium]